ncbi:MAG: lysostaphin resistance A-like protein [Tepidiformaceae bacterium]
MLTYIFTGGLLIALTSAVGSNGRLQDVGDSLEKMRRLGEYANQRLAAAAAHQPLPAHPALLADQTALQLGFAVTLLLELSLVGIALGLSKQSVRSMLHTVGLDKSPVEGIWRPGLAVVAAYAFVAGYAIVVRALGIDILTPDPTIHAEVLRNGWTAAMAAGIAAVLAPLSEELFFRGFVFGGLLRWGFWPAAGVSAFLFAGAHSDLGSIIPFMVVGLIMSWVYWSRSTLWHSIIFHVLFNSISLVLLFAAGG